MDNIKFTKICPKKLLTVSFFLFTVLGLFLFNSINITQATEISSFTMEESIPNIPAGIDNQSFNSVVVADNTASSEQGFASITDSQNRFVFSTSTPGNIIVQNIANQDIFIFEEDLNGDGIYDDDIDTLITSSTTPDNQNFQSLAISILGDIPEGANIKLNNSIMINFASSTNSDTDISDDIATLSRFQNAVAQTQTFTPENIETGDQFTIIINSVAYDYITATSSVQNVLDGFMLLLNDNTPLTCTEDSTKLICSAITPGVPFLATTSTINKQAVAQVNNFTPSNIQIDNIFTVTINDNQYSYKSTTNNIADVLEGLHPLLDSDPAVDCTKNITTITCTATVPGLPFTASTSVSVATVTPILTTILISPEMSSIKTGDTQQYTAMGFDQLNNPFDTTILWTSSNPDIATINATSGLAVALATGTVSIMASDGTISSTSSLTVTAPLVSLIINPISTKNINKGTNVSFIVTASNPNNGTLSYSLEANAPPGASINSTSGYFTWTPDTAGSFVFNITANDGLVATASTTITIIVTSPPSSGGGGGSSNNYSGSGSSGYNSPVSQTPKSISSINTELILLPSQDGKLEHTLYNNTKIIITIPSNTVATKTKFLITEGQLDELTNTKRNPLFRPLENSFFNITATDNSRNLVTNFTNPITINLVGIKLPSDFVNFGIYYFNNNSRQWLIMPGATYNPAKQTFNFNTNHFTLFGIFYIPATVKATESMPKTPEAKKVLGTKIKTYPNGTLIKGLDKKIFIIITGKKKKISTLSELQKYKGKPIITVDNSTLAYYKEVIIPQLKNGDLIKSANGKIYIISKGKKYYIKSLADLKKHAGKKIIKVDNATLAYY